MAPVFKSKKQKECYLKEMYPRPNKFVKFINQFENGDIILHHFFYHNYGWMGYAVIIGPRGDQRTNHNFTVIGDNILNLRLV